jgi:hypothetical protein
MKVIAAEVAAHLGMLTRKAATESRATTGEMASAEPAAHAGAAAEPAHASAAEPAHVSATHVAATEPAAHMSATPETPAARETSGRTQPRAAYPRRCSSNASGLPGRNSARILGIRATFQRDILRRHF